MTPVSVLLVDDNSTFLRLATRFLDAYGHNEVVVIGEARGGREALVRIEELKPQVVLLDLSMPDLPGLKVIPRLRAMVTEVGIIALTVMDNEFYRKAALAAGADEFVPKATISAELLPAIRRVMHTGGKPGLAEPEP
ncbi:MAG: response regulator transcription factor [Candidatus Latescibacterota bacterium]